MKIAIKKNLIQLILAGIYTGFVLVIPILDTYIIKLGWFTATSGQLSLIFTMGIVDVLTQHWGKREAQQMVISALIVQSLFYLAVFPLIFMLPASRDLGASELFHQSMRNFLVVMVLTLITRVFITIPIFARMKAWFSVKYNVTGIIFVLIFGIISPILKYTGVNGVNLMSLIVTGIAFKILIMVAGTPIASGLNKVVGELIKRDAQTT